MIVEQILPYIVKYISRVKTHDVKMNKNDDHNNNQMADKIICENNENIENSENIVSCNKIILDLL